MRALDYTECALPELPDPRPRRRQALVADLGADSKDAAGLAAATVRGHSP